MPDWLIYLIIGSAIVVGLDIYFAIRYGWSGTISWWVWTNSVKYPIIPAAMSGIVCATVAHFYWNIQTLIEAPVFILFGHFWWDQELNVTVKGGTDT